MGCTGKHGGNDMLCCPVSVINDGLMELVVITKKEGFGGMVKIMDEAIKRGGIHAYGDNIAFARGKSLRIVSKRPKTGDLQHDLQVFSVDGEVLWFTDFV